MAPTVIDSDDPFVTSTNHEPHRQRYSAFDQTNFSFYTNGSPGQAKRALEAHLAETDRRLQETSQLGTVLVQQRKELGDRLKEVEQQQSDSEIEPDLRRKLVELERECNEVSKDTARAFIPKARVPSGENVDASGATVLSNDVLPSPSKISAPSSRRQRNQQPGRVNDIRLATEISSSLLLQLRELQAVLASKDDSLKHTESDKAKLEIEVEGLMQRLRAMDESEQRYKDENWSLETQVHEFITSSKEAADREQRLNQALNTTKTSKSSIERELEELKQSHAKLADDHSASRKHHDLELVNIRRNVTASEIERSALQKRIDELTSRNDELAHVLSAKLKAEDDAAARDLHSGTEDHGQNPDASDNSPPPSPNKATPRHGQLESETLKSSLHHAHRMIQNLKNNIHREKTEKIELKRLLADAREELDAKRVGLGSAKKLKKGKDEPFKKPARPDRLGGLRDSQQEIILDEPDWEDHDGPATPSRIATTVAGGSQSRPESAADTSTDTYETATENDDAFETATEREGTTTESDAFQTGVESLANSSDGELTETEVMASTIRPRRPPPAPVTRGDRSHSFLSTASTSADEMDDTELRTPIQAQPKYRLKMNRSSRRSTPARSMENSVQSPESFQDSPASFISQSSDRAPAGQSLFDQLGGLSGGESDEEDQNYARSIGSRSTSVAPDAPPVPPLPQKAPMVDSEMMTEPWEAKQPTTGVLSAATAATGAVGAAVAGALGFSLGKELEQATEPVAIQSREVTPEIFGTPTTSLSKQSVSSISSQDLRPREPAINAPPALSASSVMSGYSSVPVPSLKPALSVSSIHAAQQIQPKGLSLQTPLVPAPVIVTEYKQAPTPALSRSSVHRGAHVEPRELSMQPPVVPAPVIVERAAPVTPQALSQSSMHSGQHMEPRNLSVQPRVVPAPVVVREQIPAPRQALSLSAISAGPQTAPLAAQAVVAQRQKLAQSTVSSGPQITPLASSLPPVEPKQIVPAPVSIAEPKEIIPRKPALTYSPIFSQDMIPREARPVTSSTAVALAPTSAISSDADRAEKTPGSPEAKSEPKSAVGLLGSVLGWRKSQTEPIVADDEMSPPSASNRDLSEGSGTDRRAPLQSVSGNTVLLPTVDNEKATKLRIPTLEQSTQTSLSAEEIDKMLKTTKHAPPPVIIPAVKRDRGSASPIRANTSSPRRAANASSPTHDTGKFVPRRPGSAGSTRSRAGTPPPLPPDHKEVIAAAQKGTVPSATPGTMGPPLLPASAYRNSTSRPRTPVSGISPMAQTAVSPSSRSGPTPRARASTIRSEISAPSTRRSSVSSFASELDQRFNISRAAAAGIPDIDGQSTDPRMIQAITQTMIGEYLWKYTRKAGRGDMSEKRHRRFFWVHPYTRTLYWSDTDPQAAGRAQLKAKSVAIEAVQVVTDDNPMPPGLHRKSIIIQTPGRNVKFTATTGQRHETWVNSLSYLLLRTGAEREEDSAITAEELDEFNPGHRRTPSRNTQRSRMSTSTSHTTATRNRSSSRNEQATVRRSDSRNASQQHTSVSSRLSSLSGMFRPASGMRGSLIGRNSTSSKPESSSLADATTVHDSTEDLRQVIESQERDADRLENVRACCDGKHDVGSLTHSTHRASSATHRHSSIGTISRSQRNRASGPGPHLHSHHEMPTDGRVE